MQAVFRQTAIVLEMIKFQHTVFALPFALASMLMAAGGIPSMLDFFWIVAACIFARTAAMSFNRWADQHIDRRNPRTAMRAIPAGQLSGRFVLVFAVISAACFMVSAAMLNALAFMLSPLALLILFGYSYAKRFTSLAHFILGLALALSPIGAWIAIREEIAAPAVLLGLGVMLWTAGFDLIYACQDTEVDKREGLFSIPTKAGVKAAIVISRGLYVAAIIAFMLAGYTAQMDWPYFTGVGIAAALLAAEHMVVDPYDLKQINLAFFSINSWVGMAIFAGTALDIFTLN